MGVLSHKELGLVSLTASRLGQAYLEPQPGGSDAQGSSSNPTRRKSWRRNWGKMPSSNPSPASSQSSGSSRRFDDQRSPPALEDLVNHFVAAKRALNTHATLWTANETVNSARELLEENAILAAKNAAVKNIVDEQADALEAVRRGMHLVEAEVMAEYQVMLLNTFRCD